MLFRVGRINCTDDHDQAMVEDVSMDHVFVNAGDKDKMRGHCHGSMLTSVQGRGGLGSLVFMSL